MNFSNMYTFLKFDEGKVCLCTCKVNAFGQEIGKMSDQALLSLSFKQVLSGLINPSFNKSYMRLLSKKQKKNYIYLLLPSATRKKIGPQGKRDRLHYSLFLWLESIGNMQKQQAGCSSH